MLVTSLYQIPNVTLASNLPTEFELCIYHYYYGDYYCLCLELITGCITDRGVVLGEQRKTMIITVDPNFDRLINIRTYIHFAVIFQPCYFFFIFSSQKCHDENNLLCCSVFVSRTDIMRLSTN